MSSAGQILGGVVGGVIGAFTPAGPIIGAQIGMMVGGYLDPPKIKGNKPNTDLSVQTATYGAPVGTGYGNYAKYGNLFWVEGNQLRLETGSSGGKGGGKKARPDEIYGTFAIGFGEGEIVAFGRIWCNGKLVYDPTSGALGAKMANGDIAGNLGLYLGGASQLPDPRIQADMGAANTPAYRGLHYIVFYDWPMADYGNTLMGMQVKAEVIRSGTVTQYIRHLYIDNLIPDTNTYPGAAGTEYGYFNPRVENGIFMCDKASEANDYAYTFGISHEGVMLWQIPGGEITGEFGYIGSAAAGVVSYVGSTSGVFNVAGAPFKEKTSDPDNTCHGMAVGGDGRIYALERSSGAWLFNIYDGSTLNLISSGINNPIRLGETIISLPCIPGTNVSFCVESDGTHVWAALEGGSSSSFYVCEISPSGDLDIVHSFNTSWGTPGDETYLGLYARLAAIVAENGICYGVNDHGGFFIYDRKQSINVTTTDLSSIIEARCAISGLLDPSDIDTSAIDHQLRGYKIDGVSSIRNSLEPLQGAWPFDVIPSGYKIKFMPRGASPVATVSIDELGAVAGNDHINDILTQTREMDSQLPVKVQVTYIDVNREYDKGTGPGAWRTNTDAVNVQAIDMPIVLNADEAAGIEETLLYMYWMERTEFRFTLPPTRLALEVSDVITISDVGASYEVRLTEINYLPDGRIECGARPNNPAIYTWTAKGQEGQSVGQVLTYPGASLMNLMDIPCVDSSAMNKPGFAASLCGIGSDWPGGTLFSSDDSGQTWRSMQGFIPPGCIFGQAINAIGAGPTHVIDGAAQLTVRVFSGVLSGVSLSAMYGGANHFAYGSHGRWEIIAASGVVDNGNGTYTLSGMLRGRFGTERLTSTHAAGDLIALLDVSAVKFIGAGVDSLNIARLYRAVTGGQLISAASDVEFTYQGENLKCLSPVEVKGVKAASNDWSITWTRRTRTPVEPFAGIDAPLSESAESYVVEIYADDTYSTIKRTLSGLTSATATYTSAQQTADFGEVQKFIYVKVYQVSSTMGRGYPVSAIIGPTSLINLKSLIHFDEGGYENLYYRKLAIHCDGANASQVLTDIHGHSVTCMGNAQLSTAQYPALSGKSSSLYLDGSGDYLSITDSADWSLGSGDWTMRIRVRISGYAAGDGGVYTSALISQDEVAGRQFTFSITGTSSSFTSISFIGFSDNSSGYTIVSSSYSFSLNTWYLLEACRVGNLIYLFVDGALLNSGGTSFTRTMQDVSFPVKIGAQLFDATYLYYLNGYVSEIEFFKGVGEHTSTYSPPGIPFADVALPISDKAQNTVTVTGTAAVVADASAFGGYCLQANQSSGYVSIPPVDLAALQWTLDLWIKPDALPSGGSWSGIAHYGTLANGVGGFAVAINSSGLVVASFEYGTNLNCGVSVSVGERAHVFVMRDGDNFYMGCKGTVSAARNISTTTFVGDKGFRIGYADMTGLDAKAIKIDEWRVFSSEARYPTSGSYSPPTIPFPDP